MASVALIGGSGFIGSHLAHHLGERGGHEVTSFDLGDEKLRLRFENEDFRFQRIDIRSDAAELDRVVQSSDVVVNLAAHVRPASFLNRPIDVVDLNLTASLAVVEAAVRHRKFLLHFSTSEVYGRSDGSEEPFREDVTGSNFGPVANHRWIYASAKLLLDRIIHAHGLAGALDYVIVRPFNVIGPLMDDVVPRWTRAENPRVLANFLSALMYGRPLQLVNGGRSRRCFTDIDDAGAAIALLIERRAEVNREIVNIGNPANETTIANLASLLVAIYREHCDADADGAIETVTADDFYGAGYEDCDRRLPDIAKLTRLGWTPRVGLRQALTRSAIYFHRNRARLEAILQRETA